jgi:hypothetical protein
MLLGSTALEVGIGLALLYAILSIMVTAARELIEALLQTRAIHLERGIRELLNDENGKLAEKIYAHPYISSLYRGSYDPEKSLTATFALFRLWNRIWGDIDPWKQVRYRSKLPAYIPARNFAVALLDTAGRGAPRGIDAISGPLTIEQIRQGIAKMANPEVRRALMIALEGSGGSLEKARENIEKWFDASMDRVSGWYKKQTQWILLALGLLLAVGLNVDSLRIASALYRDDALRAAAVKQAEVVADRFDSADPDSVKALGCAVPAATATAADRAEAGAACAKSRIDAIGYPIGWEELGFKWSAFLGWLLTALALSLGAPFWFDLLNKMMVIRSTVKPHEKSPEEASQDRQSPAPPPAGAGARGASPGGPTPPPPAGASGLPPPGSAVTPAEGAAGATSEDPDFEPRKWSGDDEEGDL